VSNLFVYRGGHYPDWLKKGNATKFIAPFASQICRGKGVDIGANKWPLKGAIPIDNGKENAYNIPYDNLDYVYSSHCLEHLPDPVKALEYWREKLRVGGVLFLYLPHPDMEYWQPQFNRKHYHRFTPDEIRKLLTDLGYRDVYGSERDLLWSFATIGFK